MRILEFYNIWIKDCLTWPINYVKRKIKIKNIIPRLRKPIDSETIYINIHEWGGYPLKRRKNIKGIPPFECGLLYQLIRFSQQSTDKSIVLSITISDIDKYCHLSEIHKFCSNIYSVPNDGMDFSGYEHFYNHISNNRNAYVILTNSSVNSIQSDFLDSYISFMEHNPDVGILGVSASSMYYHTLLRNNFNPHIQSFFLLTTISVLNEIVKYNHNLFPGIGETNKHLLIRNGEVLLSKIALELGYNLAVIVDHNVTKLNYINYPFPKGDLRRFVKNPNAITSIINPKP